MRQHRVDVDLPEHLYLHLQERRVELGMSRVGFIRHLLFLDWQRNRPAA